MDASIGCEVSSGLEQLSYWTIAIIVLAFKCSCSKVLCVQSLGIFCERGQLLLVINYYLSTIRISRRLHRRRLSHIQFLSIFLLWFPSKYFGHVRIYCTNDAVFYKYVYKEIQHTSYPLGKRCIHFIILCYVFSAKY